jgi:OOP family OmpA-OmpF porin
MEKNKKIAVAIGVILLLGGGGYILYKILNKRKKECESKGGTWDSKTKTCKLKVVEEVVKKAYDNLNFESGKSKIIPSSYNSLNELAEYLTGNVKLNIEIVGHTDSQGDEVYNQKLSLSRANSVANYLIDKGVNKGRIKTLGLGETDPIADNTTAKGRELNRRVEFILK